MIFQIKEWQMSTEKKIKKKQQQEISNTFGNKIFVDSNDTEDDTISSMEFDDEVNDMKQNFQNENIDLDKMDVVPSLADLNEIKKNFNFIESGIDKENESKKKEPRPFLRKGSGLAKYNLSTDLNNLPYKSRKKQPQLRNIRSKYNEETQASVRRKADVHNIHHRTKTPIKKSQNPPDDDLKSPGSMFKPKQLRPVSSAKMSPVLRQIMSSRWRCLRP